MKAAQLINATKSTIVMTLLWSPVLVRSRVKNYSSFPLLSDLRLTSVQEQRLHELRRNTRARFTEILSNEQVQKFIDSMFQHYNFPTALVDMHLSRDQQLQILDIFHHFDQMTEIILTLDQKKHLDHKVQPQLWRKLAASVIL